MNGCTVKLTNEESGEYVRLSPEMCEGDAASIDDFVEVNRNKGKTVADVLTQFPDYCKNVKSSADSKRKFTVRAASESVNRYELQTFAENLIKELESEYHCKLSTDAFLDIIDMITDGSYFEGAHEHGSTPEYILEDLIYDVFEEDTGIVVSSVQTKKKNAVKASSISAATDNTVSQGDVDELVLYIVNDGNLYRQIAKPIIKNMKRKRENGDYNDNLAVKGWLHLANEGVRRYDKEFSSGKGSLRFLNESTRNAIAEELKEYYEDEVSYDDSIESSTVTANVDTNKNDRDYLITLADAVVMEMDAEYGNVINLTYDISDSAITFSVDSEVVYIQPIDQISPNWDDLTADTEELYGCVWSAVMPNF